MSETTTGYVCRGCLGQEQDMLNIFDVNLHGDFSAFTNVQVDRYDGVSALLCSECRHSLLTCQNFRRRCQLSDEVLRKQMAARDVETANIIDGLLTENNNQAESKQEPENTVISVFSDNKLTLHITPKDFDSEHDGNLICPFNCINIFTKRNVLVSHLVKLHGVDQNVTVETQYYCMYKGCQYQMNSGKSKHFPVRKTLKNHILNVHKSRGIVCDVCKLSFAQESAFERHKAVCDTRYVCASCDIEYKTNERLMVHLMRKHPHLHKEYKRQRKEMKQLARKSADDQKSAKRMKVNKSTTVTRNDTSTPINRQINTDVHLGTYNGKPDQKIADNKSDSPKTTQFDSKSVCTADTIEFYNSPQMLKHTQTDDLFATSSNETQTVFEDLLLRSEDEFETVSLSAIQTQTWPKKVNTCETQTNPFLAGMESPDLSYKETQTCFCFMDSPKPSTSHFNFPKYLFDSANSSPNGNLTSTETQTAEMCSKDVLLSFNSIMTQTSEDYALDESKLNI